MEEAKISFWYIFFSHHPYSQLDRTFDFKLLGKRMVLCARCFGKYLGLGLYLLLKLKFDIVDTSALTILLLPLPATLDWLTQTLELRKSNNFIRVITGGLCGIWMGILISTLITFNMDLLLIIGLQIVCYMVSVWSVLLIKREMLEKYLKPYEEFIARYQRQKFNVKKNSN